MKLGVMLLLQRRIQAPAVMVTNLTERDAIVARLITVKMVTALNALTVTMPAVTVLTVPAIIVKVATVLNALTVTMPAVTVLTVPVITVKVATVLSALTSIIRTVTVLNALMATETATVARFAVREITIPMPSTVRRNR